MGAQNAKSDSSIGSSTIKNGHCSQINRDLIHCNPKLTKQSQKNRSKDGHKFSSNNTLIKSNGKCYHYIIYIAPHLKLNDTFGTLHTSNYAISFLTILDPFFILVFFRLSKIKMETIVTSSHLCFKLFT